MGDDQNIAERNENGLHQNETDRPTAGEQRQPQDVKAERHIPQADRDR
jgi:hypothetical protein